MFITRLFWLFYFDCLHFFVATLLNWVYNKYCSIKKLIKKILNTSTKFLDFNEYFLEDLFEQLHLFVQKIVGICCTYQPRQDYKI